ncbi:tetratricopeptide repeat protein [Thiobacillus sedimenti]|uniref:Tetratricopeptide repeat protein n=1 Tax=Thiobacillus sedimenti TaxID=3110231 RepID=A0ABZ1CKN5_9PROT|nr:tetratricopeptide repeat protein [Thiobacillus sp. SCUT-2]WRS39635.1 tetratricopeptide repeat protein [Thiobacillus sp. SCUT-2]
MNRFKKCLLALSAMLLAIPPASADWAPSQAEMAVLPAYCAAKFGESQHPEAAKVWRASMGSDFVHVHHYCAGLNFVNRASAMTSQNKDRRGTLEAAVRNFDYMLVHTHPDFYLRPEILMNRGIALSMMNRTGEAVGDLLKSIEADPGQPRAYLALADLYEKQKNRAKALETVTEGLRHNPDTKSLQRRYAELGGKLPYPEPVAAEPAGSSVAKPDDPAAGQGAPAPGVTPPESGPSAEPKIGSPDNPYCRFCPD